MSKKESELKEKTNKSSIFSKGSNARELESQKGMNKAKIDLFNFQQASVEGITERLGGLIFSPLEVIIKKKDELRRLVDSTKQYVRNLVKALEEEDD